MKQNPIWKACSILSFLMVLAVVPAFGETEINLDDNGPAPAPAPTAQPQIPTPVPPSAQTETKKQAAVPTVVPGQVMPGTEKAPPAPPVKPVSESAVDDTASAPVVVHGVLRIKDVYEAGVRAYKDKDYYAAVKYLKKALSMPRDRYTPKFYFAEANAMLGVIYQFHIIHYGTAYRYYHEALRIDKHTRTAKKHIKEVYKYRHRKD